MKYFYILVAMLLPFATSANTIYVRPGQTPNADGSSWAMAYTLRQALQAAVPGDTIKVAAGTYIPATNIDRNSRFNVPNGVILLGGYPNTGAATDADRNWITHPTIFNGKLPQDYNSYTILMAKNLTAPTVIDGFIIEEASSQYDAGGGLQVINCAALECRNLVFRGTIGQTVGVNNSTVSFTYCAIYRNNPWGGGNVMLVTDGAKVTFSNCILDGNGSHIDERSLLINQDAWVTMTNCSITNNEGNAIYGKGNGKTTLRNCIIWNNRIPYENKAEGYDIKTVNNHVVDIDYSITQSYINKRARHLLVGHYPHFADILRPAGPDSTWFTADDGLQLTAPCSPALNAGDNQAPGIAATDILGKPRIFNAGTVDLGAYEMQTTPGPRRTVVYVNNSLGNTGANDGSSWGNAYRTLQQALLDCADTVRVAAGLYLTTNSYKDSVFVVDRKMVILGGYPQTGNPADGQRNPDLYPTILKGNYTAGPGGSNKPVMKYHNTPAGTSLDGLRFTNASEQGANLTAALSVHYGATVKITNCDFRLSPTLGIEATGISIAGTSKVSVSHCRFNPFSNINGGIAIWSIDSSVLDLSFSEFTAPSTTRFPYVPQGFGVSINMGSATIDSCTFFAAGSSLEGTMVGGEKSILKISRCSFWSRNSNVTLVGIGNTDSSLIESSYFNNHGAPLNRNSLYVSNSHIVVNKCLFDTTAGFHVGNVNNATPVFNNCVNLHGAFMKNQRSFPVVNNCTIVNDEEDLLVTNEDSAVFRANNSIFWTLKLPAGAREIVDTVNVYQLDKVGKSILNNCITQYSGTHGANGNQVGINPRFRQFTDFDGPDNIRFTPDDGLYLAACSPAINTGGAGSTLLATDVLNQPRVTQGKVDIGAYEYQEMPNTSNSYYVNRQAIGSNDGSSWTNAYRELQTAICNACADTIRVAAGIYKPAVNNRDSSFFINRPLTLLGGYPSTGLQNDSNRDWINNTTILSGNIGDLDDSLDNSLQLLTVIGVKDSVLIDGFTIRDGYSRGGLSLNAEGGAGLYVYRNITNVNNCRFINNSGPLSGGALYVAGEATCRLSNTLFEGNVAANEGGAIYSKGALFVNRCAFNNNRADIFGGAINSPAGIYITNSIFYRNAVTYYLLTRGGGAIYGKGGGYIANCTFVENKVLTPGPNGTMMGAGIYLDRYFNGPVTNCLFYGNTVGGNTTPPGVDIGWDPMGLYKIKNNLLQVSLIDNQTNDPVLVMPGNPQGADGIWLTADDGLQPKFNSPAINAGDNAVTSASLPDAAGNQRIMQSKIDIGAYEYQDLPIADAGKDTMVCNGATVMIGKAGDPTHSYQWTSSPAGFTSSQAVVNVTPSVPTTYYLTVSKGAAMAYDTINISPANSLTPAVSITADATSICAGSNVTFTAIPLYAGANPVYQWQVDGNNAGANSPVLTTDTLRNGSTIKLTLTASAACSSPATANSNVITMMVTPVPTPAVSISALDTTVCTGSTITFTATPVNGGNKPLYEWFNGGARMQTGRSDTYSSNNLSNSYNVYVRMTSNAACAPATAVTSTPIQPVLLSLNNPSVNIITSATSICQGASATFTATAYDAGANPHYQWLINDVPVGTDSRTFSPATLAGGSLVKVMINNPAACFPQPNIASNTITMNVQPVTRSSVSIAGVTTVEEDDQTLIAAQTATSSGMFRWEDSTHTHGWQVIPQATGSRWSYSPAASGDKLRCWYQDNGACTEGAYSNVLVFTVNKVTGIAEPAGNYSIRYYPNPADNFLVIDNLKLSDQWTTLSIISFTGTRQLITQQIQNRSTVTIPVAQLSTGMYIAMLESRSGLKVYLKFMKR